MRALGTIHGSTSSVRTRSLPGSVNQARKRDIMRDTKNTYRRIDRSRSKTARAETLARRQIRAWKRGES